MISTAWFHFWFWLINNVFYGLTILSDRFGDAALDFVDLVPAGTQYTAPSSKANSELSLNRPFTSAKLDSYFGTSGGHTMSTINGSTVQKYNSSKQTKPKSPGRYTRVNTHTSGHNRIY